MTDTALMTVSEYANRFNISPQTVRRYIRQGYIPAVRVGPRLLRIDSDAPLPDLPKARRSGKHDNRPTTERLR